MAVRALCILLVLVALSPGLASAGPEQAGEEHAASAIGVPEGLVPPKLENEVTIAYPPELLELDPPPAGTVIVEATIGLDGVPRDIKVSQSVHPVLDAAIVEAVAQLRYQPATLDGQPVEVILPVPVAIAPPEPPPPPSPSPSPEPATSTEPVPDSGSDQEPDLDLDTGAEAAPEEPDVLDVTTGPVRLEGEILEAGQRTPIANAIITLVPAAPDREPGRVKRKRYGQRPEPAWQAQVRSDAEGRFSVRGLPDGKVRVVILAPGYERLEYIESLPEGQRVGVRYYATRSLDNPYRTVVRQQLFEREELTRRTIAVEEVNNLPGTQGDALKALQNFPGVARPPFGAGLLAIRGADPTDSAVFLAEHEIPQLFHFGGLTSVFNSDILSEIDFLPGNFSARYGDAIGGVIDVRPRAGRRDGYHGYIDSDLFDTGVMVEGPVGKGSFILSGRRSYIDVLLPAVLPDDAGLDLAVAPRYYDYQALFDYPVSGGNLSIKVFGSNDRLRVIASDPGEIETDDRDRFETGFAFHRVDLHYTDKIGPWSFLVTPSYRYDDISAAISELFRFRLKSHTLSTRAEIARDVTPSLAWNLGTQVEATWYDILAQAVPIPNDPSSGSQTRVLRATERDVIVATSIYAGLHSTIGERLHLYPEARLTTYSAPIWDFAFDPRLRAIWNVADNTSIKAGAGLYSQIPQPPEWNRIWGNPDALIERAVHTSVGLEQRFEPGITLEATGFYKYIWDLAVPSTALITQPDGSVGLENIASTGTGRIYGLELFFRKELTKNVFGWLSYTLSRSERRQAPGEPWILFGLDQTHLLTLLGVYRLPKNWQIGARFRLASGNPFTPYPGAVYDASTGTYFPLQGPTNSDRTPVFHQLDFRIDKRFIWRRVMLNLYLDIQNVYNQQNAEFATYSYDFSQQGTVPSLPIIPSIGLRLEF